MQRCINFKKNNLEKLNTFSVQLLVTSVHCRNVTLQSKDFFTKWISTTENQTSLYNHLLPYIFKVCNKLMNLVEFPH